MEYDVKIKKERKGTKRRPETPVINEDGKEVPLGLKVMKENRKLLMGLFMKGQLEKVASSREQM